MTVPEQLTSAAGGKIKMDRKIEGRFGRSYGEAWLGEYTEGEDNSSRTDVWVIAANASSDDKQKLENELAGMKAICNPITIDRPGSPPQGFPKIFDFEPQGGYQFLVMEGLRSSLEDMVQKSKGKFQPATAALIAEQLVRRMEYLHSKGFLHRDIKPESFCMGMNANKIHHIYIADVQNCKNKWIDESGQHIAFKKQVPLPGNPLFASISASMRITSSRRDDMEAIGHMLMYFLRDCCLPWTGIEEKTSEEINTRIMEKKRGTSLEELCKDYPPGFKDYLNMGRNLNFMQAPDYTGMRKLFSDIRSNKKDHEFEFFDQGAIDERGLEPLSYSEEVPQPVVKELQGSKSCIGRCVVL